MEILFTKGKISATSVEDDSLYSHRGEGNAQHKFGRDSQRAVSLASVIYAEKVDGTSIALPKITSERPNRKRARM